MICDEDFETKGNVCCVSDCMQCHARIVPMSDGKNRQHVTDRHDDPESHSV